MLCSIRQIETPVALIFRISPTIVAVSVGVSPAITSSRSRRTGSVASARASSRRFRSASVSPPAGASVLGPSPTRSITARARSRASCTRGCRASAPTWTLSSTDSRRNGRTIWKVRTSPSRQVACGGTPTRLRPRNRISPPSGREKPESRLNTVVLPAPLGPMRPRISPSAIAKESARTAWRPPKRFESAETSSRLTAGPPSDAPTAAPETDRLRGAGTAPPR